MINTDKQQKSQTMDSLLANDLHTGNLCNVEDVNDLQMMDDKQYSQCTLK